MSDIQEVRLKNEKRFTRKNDPDYDYFCKVAKTFLGEDSEENNLFGKDADLNWNLSVDNVIQLMELFLKYKKEVKNNE